MFRRVGKGISTALATMAIILVLIGSLVWMSYMVALNARQQAQIAGQAETAALKSKELVRVYVWLDAVKQPLGGYLNLTRISFVGEWSGETTINSLLIVWRDGRVEEKPVSIRLRAGEDRTYTPSELGIAGVDDYYAALAAIKYIQAHTSLGNDFVSLWGRPDKPALYVTGTTRTDTYTATTTTTSVTATTTTTTTTTTSYTTTWTTTRTGPPPWGTPSLTWRILENYCTYLSVQFSFNPNGWGTPPYIITGQWSASNMWGGQLASGSFGPYTTSGPYGWTVGMSAYPDPASYGWTVRVVDSMGRVAEWSGGYGVGCDYPPPPGTTTAPTPPGPTTQPPTTISGTTTYTITETVTSTSFVYVGATTTVTTTVTSTSYTGVHTTLTRTSTSTVLTCYETITITTTPTCHFTTWYWAPGGFILSCGTAVFVAGQGFTVSYERDAPLVPVSSILIAAAAFASWGPRVSGFRRLKDGVYILAAAALTVLTLLSLLSLAPPAAYASVFTTTVTTTTWVTTTVTNSATATHTTTKTTTVTFTITTETTVTTTTSSETGYCVISTCGPTTIATEICGCTGQPSNCGWCRR